MGGWKEGWFSAGFDRFYCQTLDPLKLGNALACSSRIQPLLNRLGKTFLQLASDAQDMYIRNWTSIWYNHIEIKILRDIQSKHLKGRSEPRVRHVFDSEGRSGPRDPASDTFLTRKVVRDPASDTFLTRNFRDPASDTFLTRNFRDPRPSFELAKIIFAPSKIIFAPPNEFRKKTLLTDTGSPTAF